MPVELPLTLLNTQLSKEDRTNTHTFETMPVELHLTIVKQIENAQET